MAANNGLAPIGGLRYRMPMELGIDGYGLAECVERTERWEAFRAQAEGGRRVKVYVLPNPAERTEALRTAWQRVIGLEHSNLLRCWMCNRYRVGRASSTRPRLVRASHSTCKRTMV